MVGIILISENKEGVEILKTVRRLLGKPKGIKTLMLKQGSSPTLMRQNLGRAIAEFQSEEGILLLTDIYGSTQCNVCMTFLKKGSVEIITGFNLPMVVKLASLNRVLPFKKLISLAKDYAQSHILHITNKNSVLKTMKGKK